MFPEKLLAREPGPYTGCQGMPDIGDRNAVLTEKCLFEGEDAEQAVDDTAHGFDPGFAPRPHLWSDQVDHRNAVALEFGSDTEVEIRGIGQDREAGFTGSRYCDEGAEFAPDTRQMPYDFE